MEGVASTAPAHQDMHGHYDAYGNQQPQMAQAGGYGPSVSATSESGYNNAAGVGAGALSHATSSSGTSAGYAGMGAGYQGAGGPSAFPMPMPSSHTATTSSGPSADTSHMSAKQYEAYQERQRLAVQNPSGPSGVTVHQDGGAYVEADASGSEVPPT